MAQSSRTLSNRGFFFSILIFLALTDLAVLLGIPILRPVLGFLFFTIVPGLLILHILKSNKLGLTERLVFSVGLSVAFLMFIGLLINFVGPLLGYTTPLSTNSVIISFSIILVILAIIGYKRNKDFSFNLSGFKLDTKEKAFLLLPALFPLLSILGMYLMNTINNNTMLMAMLFLIPAYVIIIAVLHQRVPQRTYPVMIFLIGISLSLMVALRSSHVIGNDTHAEYQLFQLVANSQHWQIFVRNILDACLSISLLPTIYQSLMNINSEYLFKILYPLLFSVSPLAIYMLSKKYIGSFYAFLASFFFIAQFFFIWTTTQARTNTAILFFALVIMALMNDNLSKFAKRLLVIIFAASCLVSHYATTYIFLFVLLLTWIGMEILPKLIRSGKQPVAAERNIAGESNPSDSSQAFRLARGSVDFSEDTAQSVPKPRLDKGITITFIALFFVMLFLWYSQVTAPAFSSGVAYIHRTLVNLNQMFISEIRAPQVDQAFGQTLAFSAIPVRIKFVFSWLSIAFIAIGVLSTIVGYKRMVSIPGIGPGKTNFLKSKIDAEYWILALACCIIMVLSVTLPYALKGYGMSREYLQMMTVLSMFFVIGGVTVGKFLKSKPYWLMLVILIPYFMCNSGTVDRIFGVSGAVTLSSEGPHYAHYYIYDQEAYAARWLRDNTSPKDRAIHADRGGGVRLISQAGIPEHGRAPATATNVYFYLTYYNVVNRELVMGDGFHSIAEWQDRLSGRGKIYSNGGSEIYR